MEYDLWRKDRNILEVDVLDTNVLMLFPDAFLSFKNCLVVIPLKVIEELEGLYWNQRGTTRKKARITLNKIFEFGDKVKLMSGVLIKETNSWFCLRISKGTYFKKKTPDNMIISVAIDLKNEHKGERSVKLCTRDRKMRVRARKRKIDAVVYPEKKLISQ